MYSFNALKRSAVFCAALLLSVQGIATAQDLNAKLPTDPDVVTGVLPNGLTYYIRSNHKPEKKVELRMVVKDLYWRTKTSRASRISWSI